MENTFVPIVFEDEDLLIVDKPAGMIVNRGETVKGVVTLQDWIEKKFKVQSSPASPSARFDSARREAGRAKFKVDENSDFVKRSGIVHRLDKETSGLVIIAKTEESFKNLQKQFREGNVAKTYIALVHGKMISEAGEINVPIGRLPWNRMRFGVLPRGRESQTMYKVIKNLRLKTKNKEEDLSMVEVYPKTGRTHQIRVHFQYLGHSIFADELYAGRKTKKEDRKLLSRHFLHANKISFKHPKTGIRVEFESPLPSDLVDFLKKLQ